MPVRVKPWLEEFRGYSPRSYRGVRARLDLNESPYPPPERVVEAVAREAARGNRYPEAEMLERLAGLLSSYTGARPEQIVVGLGGDMVLEKAFHLVLAPGGRMAAPRPSFSMYEVYTRLQGGEPIWVELEPAGGCWRLDWSRFSEAAAGSSLAALDNPNNPTGSLLAPGEGELAELLERLSARGALLILDEAYYEFSGVTYAGLTEAYDNLLVVRTLSKAFSLAGLRIGYAIAHPRLAERLRSIMPPFLPRTSVAAAIAALEDPGYARRVADTVRGEREWLASMLRRLPGVRVYCSYTNFLLVETPVEDVVERLAEQGVAVRRVPLGSNWLRVTVGTPGENRVFLEALSRLLQGQG
ncbi:pyridoxal phosphate-dependent aminotransferase [Pyrodictium occultum]|uniref:pyridoxal phosphate-dependent aminotransferase n=1 Tax=Pyrodictium occultum TaxID=2309 RepID=UPI00071E69DB|nr:histidinol-phosphate transaminase [Pyrodictium occultum]